MNLSNVEIHIKSISYWCSRINENSFSLELAAYLYVHCVLLVDELEGNL